LDPLQIVGTGLLDVVDINSNQEITKCTAEKLILAVKIFEMA
jgi:hypothetical protein